MNHEKFDSPGDESRPANSQRSACQSCAHSAASDSTNDLSTNDLSRRSFLQFLAAGAGVAFLHGCGGSKAPVNELPPGTTANPIAATAEGNGFKIAGAGDLRNGQALAFKLPDQSPGIVFRTNAGELRALSARCTHSGCTVQWERGQDMIQCPCHGSRFDTTGKALSGPAIKSLPSFKTTKVGSDALISKA